MAIHELQQVTCQDQCLWCLKEHIIQGWLEHNDQVQEDITPHWTFKDGIAIIDGVIMKGKNIVVPEVLEQQALQQLHINYKGIEKLNSKHVNHLWDRYEYRH